MCRTRFNTQPPEGGWDYLVNRMWLHEMFQHTAARRRLVHLGAGAACHRRVSTHSRPKAAGIGADDLTAAMGSFNTQPPEGGWLKFISQTLR